MKYRVKSIVALLLLIFSLSSCKRPEIYYKTEEVIISNAYHDDAWVEVKTDGKNVRTVYHDATDVVTVQFNGRSYSIYGSGWYNRYFDRIGDTVTAKIEYKDYGKNWIFLKIVSLEG